MHIHKGIQTFQRDNYCWSATLTSVVLSNRNHETCIATFDTAITITIDAQLGDKSHFTLLAVSRENVMSPETETFH